MRCCYSELYKDKPDQLQGSALLTGRAFVGLQICSSANTVIARPSSPRGQGLHWPEKEPRVYAFQRSEREPSKAAIWSTFIALQIVTLHVT